MKDLPSKLPLPDPSQPRIDEICAFVKDFTKREMLFLVMILSGATNSDIFIKLFSVFEKDTILYLGLFNSSIVRVPNLKALQQLKFYVRIFMYLERYEFSTEAYEDASKIFGRRVHHLKAIVNKVNKYIVSMKTLVQSLDTAIDGVDDIAEMLYGLKQSTPDAVPDTGDLEPDPISPSDFSQPAAGESEREPV